MLEHELFHWLVLREGLKVPSGEENIGRETNMPILEKEAESCALNARGRGLTDALLLLQNQRQIVLQKVLPTPRPYLGYTTVSFAEYPSDRAFLATPFNIVVTPLGVAYFNELDTRVRAMVQGASGITPAQKRIGFHS